MNSQMHGWKDMPNSVGGAHEDRKKSCIESAYEIMQGRV
jgi:hypothetical protein